MVGVGEAGGQGEVPSSLGVPCLGAREEASCQEDPDPCPEVPAEEASWVASEAAWVEVRGLADLAAAACLEEDLRASWEAVAAAGGRVEVLQAGLQADHQREVEEQVEPFLP